MIITVAGGSFTICKYAKDGEVAEYKLRIESLERSAQEIEKRLELCLKASDRQTSLNQLRNLGENSVTYVSIIAPQSGSLIEKFITIRIAVQGSLLAGVKPLLVVRDPLGQWWSWGTSNTGTFEKIQIGSDRDSGDSFEIRVLLTDEEFPRNQPRPNLPRSIASDSVIVVRR